MRSSFSPNFSARANVGRVGLFLLCASTAHAHEPPMPAAPAFFSLILLLPLNILLFQIAGGHHVRKALHSVPESKWRIGFGVATFFVVLYFPAFMFMTFDDLVPLPTVVFGAFGLARGAQLIRWSDRLEKLRKDNPKARLPSRKRLQLTGKALFITTAIMMTFPIALRGHYDAGGPRSNHLRNLVKTQIALATAKASESDERIYPQKAVNPGSLFELGDSHFMHFRRITHYPLGNTRFEYASDGAGFTIDCYPTFAPIFPYFLFAPRRSFRGDQSGEIRAERVWKKGKKCSPDAPVVHIVNQAEVNLLVEAIKSRSNPEAEGTTWMEIETTAKRPYLQCETHD